MGIHPHGLTMRELDMMARGKMELLGLTKGEGGEQRMDYDPRVLQRIQSGS